MQELDWAWEVLITESSSSCRKLSWENIRKSLGQFEVKSSL